MIGPSTLHDFVFQVVALLSVSVFPFPTRFLGFSLEEGAPHKKRNTGEGLRQ